MNTPMKYGASFVVTPERVALVSTLRSMIAGAKIKVDDLTVSFRTSSQATYFVLCDLLSECPEPKRSKRHAS